MNDGQFVFEIYVIKENGLDLLEKVDCFNKARGNGMSFLSHINTVPHYFTCIYDKLVIASSE